MTTSSTYAQTPARGVYEVGQTGSLVEFTISGKALLSFKREGRFNQFAGELSYDPDRPAGTRVDLTVYTNSVDMHNREQDELLMSNDFFDAEHFPTMHFTGSLANAGSDGALRVVGDLTIRGVTKQISAPVALLPVGAQSAAMFETSFQIDRTEFGLNGTSSWHGWNVSIARNVQIHIAIAAAENRPDLIG